MRSKLLPKPKFPAYATSLPPPEYPHFRLKISYTPSATTAHLTVRPVSHNYDQVHCTFSSPLLTYTLGILLGVVLYQLMLINFYYSLYLSFVSLVHMH